MLFLYSFFGLLLLLFFLSRILVKKLSFFLYFFTRSHRLTVYLFAIFFLPGTFIHELAHYLMAVVLFVPAGNMTLLPIIEGESVRLGSVAIGRTDPFRRLLIGLAPFLLGTVLIILFLFLFLKTETPGVFLSFLTGYVLFEIGNTMFSSKKDMEGALELLLAVLAFGIVLTLLGLRIPSLPLEFIQTAPVVLFFERGSYFLLFPICIDIATIAILSLSNKLFMRKY